MARVIVTAQLPANSPYQMVLKLFVGTVALLGSYHAVSGASNTIITSPTSVTGTVGRAFSYRTTLSGQYASSSPIYYRATVNGTAQPGQAQNVPAPGLVAGSPNTSSYITGTPTTPGTYNNLVWASGKSDFSGDRTSKAITITVLPVSPPSITGPPSNQTVNPAANVTFAVTATDTNGPLSYRWYFNGSPVFGGTNASLTLNNVQSTNAGTYKVNVNGVGGTVSATATLTVSGPPAIITQPQAQYVAAGGTAILSVVAGGAATLQYQWRFHGEDLPGRTAATLALANVQLTNAGRYSVVVSNSLGTVTSSDAFLRVAYGGVPTPTAVFGLNQNWRYDASARDLGKAWREFDYDDSVWASGPGTLGLENNATFLGLVGSVGTTLPINAPGGAFITNFYFRSHFTVANTSQVTSLTFSNLIDDGAIGYLNGREVFRTANMPAGDVAAATYATGSAVEATSYLVFTVSPTNLMAGDNVLAVEVHQQALNSSDVVFGMALNTSVNVPNTAPLVLTNPEPQTVDAGTNVTLSVLAEGTAPLRYQWLKDGIPVAGATSATLALSNVQTTNAGNYSVIVSNAYANVTSQSAALGVKSVAPPAPPVLTSELMVVQGQMVITCQTSSTHTHIVEYSDTLAAGSWQVLTNIAPGGQTITITDSTTAPRRYYRVRLAP